MSAVVDDKLSKLKSLLRSFESCVIAYSGGVDSVFLAVVAHEVLGDSAVAVIADSPSLPRHELQEAKSIAKSFGFRMEVIETQEFKNDEYLSNPVNRCYFCKAELFQRLVPYARDNGFQVIAYGENASDVGDYRPGSTAADEFSVRAPLRDANLSKDEIRELSKKMGLPTADKPAQPCLSSRIPYGEVVSSEKLQLIEHSEQLIRRFGFVDVRVRLHESKQGYLGRIELPGNDLERFFVEGCFKEVGLALRQLGFNHITVDLLGYRRGSLNEGIRSEASHKTLQGRPAESLPQA